MSCRIWFWCQKWRSLILWPSYGHPKLEGQNGQIGSVIIQPPGGEGNLANKHAPGHLAQYCTPYSPLDATLVCVWADCCNKEAWSCFLLKPYHHLFFNQAIVSVYNCQGLKVDYFQRWDKCMCLKGRVCVPRWLISLYSQGDSADQSNVCICGYITIQAQALGLLLLDSKKYKHCQRQL